MKALVVFLLLGLCFTGTAAADVEGEDVKPLALPEV